jgi:acetyl-CoA acetyltransferase
VRAPRERPCTTINKVCGSGPKAVGLAAQAIAAGDARVLVAGGMENMSASPHLVSGMRAGHRMGDVPLVDSMVRDGLWCAFCDVHMGVTAENVAAEDEISRAEQDAFALRSQRRAAAALDAGTFDDGIVGVPVPQRRGEPERAGVTIGDIDLFELNEAFAAQSIAVCRRPGLDEDRVNVHGGAIALGHPIGASGARVLTTLLHEMARRDARLGVAALCIGGGQGIAMVVERPEGAPGG